MARGVFLFVCPLVASCSGEPPSSCPSGEQSLIGANGVSLLHVRHTLRLASATSRSLEQPSHDFEIYMATFGRDYQVGSLEHSQRQAIFQRRVQAISAHNARAERTWTAGVNFLTDRTDGELAQLRGWRHVPKGHGNHGPNLLSREVRFAMPLASEVNWQSRLAMASNVPDQAQCGSCWAQASATMLSARHEAQRNQSRTFSAQELVDCVPNPHECGGSGGCSGSTVELAMAYVQAMGLSDDAQIPYTAKDGRCKRPLPEIHHGLNGGSHFGMLSWEKLPQNEALPLMQHVMEGPVAVSVAASDWWFYVGGIFDKCDRNATVNHAVVLFGYGIENGTKYWSLRNSWGTAFGEQGFIRLKRSDTPTEDDAYCGTDNDPGAGVACKPYPDSVQVCGMCGILYDSVAVHFAQ